MQQNWNIADEFQERWRKKIDKEIIHENVAQTWKWRNEEYLDCGMMQMGLEAHYQKNKCCNYQDRKHGRINNVLLDRASDARTAQKMPKSKCITDCQWWIEGDLIQCRASKVQMMQWPNVTHLDYRGWIEENLIQCRAPKVQMMQWPNVTHLDYQG